MQADEQKERIINMSYTYFAGKKVTPELIREYIDIMVRGFSDPDLDKSELFRDLELAHNVSIIGASSALEDLIDHEDWFNPVLNIPLSRDFDWHFWKHYKQYLEIHKKWAPSIVEELDSISTEILSKIEDPHRAGIWDRRGMVMGSVQSGKTANFTALITKAADAGYKLIIVLAGVHNSLRSQTQYRLNEEFLGYDLDKIEAITSDVKSIGVKKIFHDHKAVNTLTSSNERGDFNKQTATRVGVLPGKDGPPLILVVKKNVSILKNVTAWASNMMAVPDENGKRIIEDIPLLLIDDECDYATINTKRPEYDEEGNIVEEWDPAKTNMRIRQLLSIFKKSIYIGYTATPYANIFIHKDHVHPKYGEDLFPRSFIITLPQPSNYIGPDTIFGLDAYEEQNIDEKDPLPLTREIGDNEPDIPGTHTRDLIVSQLPDSLCLAIKCFILACAARHLRKSGTPHCSMLIHVTRFTNVQNQIGRLVKDKLKTYVSRIMSGSDQLLDFKSLWEDDFQTTTNEMLLRGYSDSKNHSWSEIEGILYESVRKITLKEINGEAKDTLDYREAEINAQNLIQAGQEVTWDKKGISVIAIGGDKLSRGLTLDGLIISYYLRASRMYDTLMQMGRWFGYRAGYNDLCRIFTTQELSDWYRHIAGATIELRNEIDYMSAIGSTPEEFGLKVRSHPGRLIVTSAGKSRDAEEISLSYNNRRSETIVFNPKHSTRNLNTLEELIKKINRPTDYPVNEKSPKYRWSKIDSRLIINFLRNYFTQEQAKKIVDPARMADYIERQNLNRELTTWDVAIISKKNKEQFIDIADFEKIGCVERKPIYPITTDKLSIKILVGSRDEMIDLTEEEIQNAIEFDRVNRGRKVPDTGQPSGIAIRHIRPPQRGLLLIYPCFCKNKFGGREEIKKFIGFGISFPNSENAIPIIYSVNPVHLEVEESL